MAVSLLLVPLYVIALPYVFLSVFESYLFLLFSQASDQLLALLLGFCIRFQIEHLIQSVV